MRYTNIAGLNFYSIRVEKIAKKKKRGICFNFNTWPSNWLATGRKQSTLNIITTDYGIAVGGYVPFHFHFPATSNTLTGYVCIYIYLTYIQRIQVSIKHVGSRLTANIVTIIVLRSCE